MKELVAKFCNGRQLGLDQCLGTVAMAKPCMMHSKHRNFVGCEIDAVCFNKLLPSVMEIFAQQVFNEYLDIRVVWRRLLQSHVCVCNEQNPGKENEGDVGRTSKTACDVVLYGVCCVFPVELF